MLTKIRDVAGHGRSSRNSPDDRCDDGERRPDYRVDQACEWANAMFPALMEEVGCETEHDYSKDKLRDTKDEGGEAREQHIGGCVGVVSIRMILRLARLLHKVDGKASKYSVRCPGLSSVPNSRLYIHNQIKFFVV